MIVCRSHAARDDLLLQHVLYFPVYERKAFGRQKPHLKENKFTPFLLLFFFFLFVMPYILIHAKSILMGSLLKGIFTGQFLQISICLTPRCLFVFSDGAQVNITRWASLPCNRSHIEGAMRAQVTQPEISFCLIGFP